MSKSEITTLKESVEREAEMHPVELDAIRHIENEDGESGITLRILETDGETEADQVGFQITKPNTQMGRQVFSERLGQGFRALSDHIRNGDDASESDSERQVSDTEDSVETETAEAPVPDNSKHMEDDNSPAPAGHREPSPPTREVGSFSITTSLDEDSLEALATELDSTFEDITDELPDEERISGIEDDIDDLDDRLSVLEEKLAILGSFDDGG